MKKVTKMIKAKSESLKAIAGVLVGFATIIAAIAMLIANGS